jgi:hypothetical protein
MIDFPSNPTVGQQFTAAGVMWTWDGAKWTAQGLSPTFLPLSGGTLTGPLNAPVVSLQNTAGNANPLWGDIGGNARWLVELGDGAPETGNNAGSNFAIVAYSDAAVSLGADFTINRATGVVSASNLSAPQAMGSNRIINGDMRIDQRNSGASGTASGVYTIDRWIYGASQTNRGSWQRGTAGVNLIPVGFGNYLAFVSSSAYTPLAADQFNFQQRIEADMVSDLCWGTANAQPVTLSFWAFSSLTGTFGGSIRNDTGTRSYPFSFNIPAASTWTPIVITIPGDTAGTWVMSGNGEALRVYFDLGAGANFRGTAGAWTAGDLRGVTGAVNVVATNGASFNLTGVKLEIGSVATPFNRKTTAQSLLDCQRYYQRVNAIWSGNATSGAVYSASAQLPSTPRVATTLTGTSAAANGFANAIGTLGGGSPNSGTVIDTRVCSATTTGASFTTTIFADDEL